MRHYVVNYSGGLSSHLAAHRIVEEVGAKNVTLLFCDTNSEDEDLYRFNREGAAALGCRLTTIADGRDIWEVFADERFLGNSRIDPCSKKLKRQLADRWMAKRFTADNSVRVFGYTVCELGRLNRTATRMAPWPVRAPLCETPTLKAGEVRAEFEELFPNIRVPRLYDLGAPHNNCGGLCVKAGQKHFAWALENIPHVYAEWEAKEEGIRRILGDVSILTDHIGGTKKPLTMRAFRERIECGGRIDSSDRDKSCNCFDPIEEEPANAD